MRRDLQWSMSVERDQSRTTRGSQGRTSSMTCEELRTPGASMPSLQQGFQSQVEERDDSEREGRAAATKVRKVVEVPNEPQADRGLASNVQRRPILISSSPRSNFLKPSFHRLPMKPVNVAVRFKSSPLQTSTEPVCLSCLGRASLRTLLRPSQLGAELSPV